MMTDLELIEDMVPDYFMEDYDMGVTAIEMRRLCDLALVGIQLMDEISSIHRSYSRDAQIAPPGHGTTKGG